MGHAPTGTPIMHCPLAWILTVHHTFLPGSIQVVADFVASILLAVYHDT